MSKSQRGSVLDTVAGVRRGGLVRRDAGPWLVFWLVVSTAVLFGVGALATGSWKQDAVTLFLAIAAVGLAVRAFALTRTEAWHSRRELLGVLRTMNIKPGANIMLNRDSRLVYGVGVKRVRILPPLGPRVQRVWVTEFGEDHLLSLADADSVHLTGRSFELLPWEAGVRATVRDATFGSGEEAAQLTYRQWFPDERTAVGLIHREWRVRRAGSRFASPGDIRLLAAGLAAADSISPERA